MRMTQRMLVAGLAMGVASAAAAQVRVAVVIATGGQDAAAQTAAQLNDDTYFDFTATVVDPSQVDSLGELAAFDVVVLGDDGFANTRYPAALEAALRQWVDQGGGVVMCGWYNYITDQYTGQQLADAEYITPYVEGGYQFQQTPATMTIMDNSHPITQGLSDFSANGRFIEFAGSGLDTGAVQLGTVNGAGASRITIAYKEIGGRTVYLGGIYMANEGSYGNQGMRSGPEDRLLEQACNWAAGGVAPPPPCYADCDGNGRLDIRDFFCFQAQYAGGCP